MSCFLCQGKVITASSKKEVVTMVNAGKWDNTNDKMKQAM